MLLHSSVDEHLFCLHSLTIMNYTAINIHIQVFVLTYVSYSLGCIRELELISHVITAHLTFDSLLNCFLNVPFYILTSYGVFVFVCHIFINT